MQSSLQFSLVLGTVGRTDELGRMLDSLCRQTHRNFEVILVDQNPGPELDDLRASYDSRIAIRHVRARLYFGWSRFNKFNRPARCHVAGRRPNRWFSHENWQSGQGCSSRSRYGRRRRLSRRNRSWGYDHRHGKSTSVARLRTLVDASIGEQQ